MGHINPKSRYMRSETKEQRLVRQAAEQEERDKTVAAYRLTIPARLMAAQTFASTLGLRSTVTLTETGPSVQFYDQYSDDGFCEAATYQMEQWELEYLENRLQERKAEQDAKAARKKLAEDTWSNKLSHEEKVAIKEFISYLRT